VDVRVARWYVFKPKILIWVHFGGPWNEKSWYTIWPFGNLAAIWYIFQCFGILNIEKSRNPGGRFENSKAEDWRAIARELTAH
jgi:hypothetical protein